MTYTSVDLWISSHQWNIITEDAHSTTCDQKASKSSWQYTISAHMTQLHIILLQVSRYCILDNDGCMCTTFTYISQLHMYCYYVYSITPLVSTFSCILNDNGTVPFHWYHGMFAAWLK